VETSLGISQASYEGKYGREGILNSGRILAMVVCLGGTTLAGIALAQETQNAETQVTRVSHRTFPKGRTASHRTGEPSVADSLN
jgi:hypothetical protein